MRYVTLIMLYTPYTLYTLNTLNTLYTHSTISQVQLTSTMSCLKPGWVLISNPYFLERYV